MSTLIKKVRVIDIYADIDVIEDVFIDHDVIMIAPLTIKPKKIINGQGCLLIPGLIDMHVHFRDPGYTYKEDIISGIKAALAGGVTSVLVMPNTNPVIDQVKHVIGQFNKAKSFNLMVAAAATMSLKGSSASDISKLAQAGVKAITDDGHCVNDEKLLEKILKLCRLNNLVFLQHAEDKSISKSASFNEGISHKKWGMLGQHYQAESNVIARDIKIALRVGCRYHALHISCQESLNVIKKAKSSLISCEVSPHHLFFSERDTITKHANAKMNPPLRSKEDVYALIQGIDDGFIDVVASDHAPHSYREKSQSIMDAPFGVVGLESSILVLLTLVKKYDLSLTNVLKTMTLNPARILNQSGIIGTMIGAKAKKNAVLLDPDHHSLFLKRHLYGRSFNSPFIGELLWGKVKATFNDGRLVYGDLV